MNHWRYNIRLPSEEELENLKSNAERVKCNIPGKSDEILNQQMTKLMLKFQDN